VRSAALLLLIILVWSAGLVAFAGRIARSTPAREPAVADGVVALTGASDVRITAAMKLLETGKARRMLISGVNQQASRADIRGVAKATRRLYDCCVDLDRQALDTVGNARETAVWARKLHYRSLILVTSDFHMPRAMLEERAALPEVSFIPYPVRSADFDARHWWRSQESARRMVLEYCKYLAILTRESLLSLGPKAHPPDPAAPGAVGQSAAPSGAPA
jgi:uncharacterized SAM-binding protein YcdF (DUF218 family)